MIKRVEAIAKFLQAARNLSKQGISKDQVIEFAKREFGEVSDLLKRQIEQIFTPKSGGITSIKKPEGKVIKGDFDQASGTSIDQEDFLRRIGKQIEEDRKTLGPIGKETKEGGITYSIPEKGIIREKASAETIMDRLMGASNRLRELQKEQEAMFKPKKGFDVAEGLTRTIARRILDKKNIQIGKRDPIDVYSDIFGEAVTDVKNLADELIEIDAAGGGTKNLDEMIKQEGLFDIDIPENPQRGMSDDEFIKFLKDKGVDPDDTGFASGGRVQYRFGSGMRLAGFLAIRGKTLKEEIKKAVQNIFASGDRKVDADVAVDDMLEELGASREQFDQKDILEAYDEAYQALSKPIKQGDAITSENFGSSQFAPDTRDLEEARRIAPKLTERFELRKKYPGIDEDLLTQIIDDPDPQRKAEVLATLDQSMELMKQGKGSEEVVDILQKETKRKDNADGGLNYLMGM